MKKFIDKIRDDDEEEVELSPRAVDEPSDSRGDEPRLLNDSGDDQEENDTGGMLPGMGSSASTADSDEEDSPDDRLDTIIEQNRRIIELLEQISSSYEDSQTGNSNDIW
ncbi:MAG: hypothetical protein SVU32_03125 [Candidatus Nanohaloarchaea archaeon]|nr:hypothetical protein [Candidatus Nanohaloarchaea archaeon]